MINTQSELIEHLRFLSGKNSTALSETDAVRLLNFAIDDYSYIAITADGKWQFDDTENSDLPRASATLSANSNRLPVTATHLAIKFVELVDSDGNKSRITPFDRRFEDETTPKTTTTGRPSSYDYESGVLYFDVYAKEDYTINMHFTRAVNHLVVGASSQAVGIPSIHTEYLALHALARLGLRNNDTNRIQARQEVDLFEDRIRDFYSRRDEDTDQKIIGNMDIRT